MAYKKSKRSRLRQGLGDSQISPNWFAMGAAVAVALGVFALARNVSPQG